MSRAAIIALALLAACHKRDKATAEEEASALTGGVEVWRCSGTAGDGCGGNYGDGYICIAPASGRAAFCSGDERKPCYIVPMGTIPAERGR